MAVFIVIARQWAAPCGVPGGEYLHYPEWVCHSVVLFNWNEFGSN